MPEPAPDGRRASAPDFLSFVLALSDPRARTAIGVHIPDEDAVLLEQRRDWAVTFYRQWTGEDLRSEPGAPIALPRVLATPPEPLGPMPPAVERTPMPAPPVRPARSAGSLRAATAMIAAGAVLAAGLVGVGLVQTGATATPSTPVPVDPFPAGLAGPDAPPGSDASAPTPPATDREGRLGAEVASALNLDERTAAVPGVRAVVQTQIVRLADLACLQGYDETLSARIAQAVSGRSDLGEAAGPGVADAIARYCASAPAAG